MSSILLTGGMGYIGSHTAVELLENGHNVVHYDNLSNSTADVKDKIQTITNKEVSFIEGDWKFQLKSKKKSKKTVVLYCLKQ